MLSSALLLTTVLWTTTAVSPILSAPIPIIHQIEQEQGVHQVALLSPHLSTTSKERYDGHQVWRVDWADLGAEVKEEILAAAGVRLDCFFFACSQETDISPRTALGLGYMAFDPCESRYQIGTSPNELV